MAVVLAACALLYRWPAIARAWSGGAQPWDGLPPLPFFAEALAQWRELSAGRAPLWCPAQYAGQPCLALEQPAFFYPLRLPTWALLSLGLRPAVALQLEVALHLWLATFGAYCLGRRLLPGRLPALVLACLYTYGGYLGHSAQAAPQIAEAAAWLPWALCSAAALPATGRLVSRPLSVGALALGMGLLAGDSQIALLCLYLTLAYGLFRQRSKRSAVQLGLMIALGLLVAAGRLWPLLAAILGSARAGGGQLLASGLPMTAFPGLWLGWGTQAGMRLYFGMMGLVLMGAALFLAPLPDVWFWAAVCATGLLGSFGGEAIVHPLLYLLLPGWRFYASPEAALLLLNAGAAALGGYGAAALLQARWCAPAQREAFARGAVGLVWVGGFATGVFFLGFLAQGLLPQSEFGPLTGAAIEATLMAFLSLLVLRWAVHFPAPGSRTAAAALAILLFDLFCAHYQQPHPALTGSQAAVLSFLAQSSASEQGRIFNEWALPAGYGSLVGAEDIWGEGGWPSRRFEEFARALPPERLYRFLAVRHIVSSSPQPPPGAELVFQAGEGPGATYVYRLREPPLWAWLANKGVVAQPQRTVELLAELSEPFPPQTALLEEPPPVVLGGEGNGQALQLLERRPGSLRLAAYSSTGCLLIFSMPFYPGWQATVDGARAPILRAEHSLVAIPLPPGSHEVLLEFCPRSFGWGLALTALGLLGLATTAALAG